MVHLKYPSMERQDLTQSQLGSFKFTPVDDIHDCSLRRRPYPFVAQQFAASLENGRFDKYWLHSLHSPAHSSSSIFDTQIKPDLDDSRLRLGPAAVRAAVESASSSPPKHFVGVSNDNIMRANANNFLPQDPKTGYDSARFERSVRPRVDPTAQEMSPSRANPSLLRALENEQQAHQMTQLSLESEISKRLECEAETRRLTEHNKSLLNSIRLLQSTVKHMVQRESSSDLPEEKSIDAAIKEFKVKVEKSSVKDSILYDPLRVQKSKALDDHLPYQTSEATNSAFNLDLIQRPANEDDSEKAQLQRTLRRQLSLTPPPPVAASNHSSTLNDEVVRGPTSTESSKVTNNASGNPFIRSHQPYVKVQKDCQHLSNIAEDKSTETLTDGGDELVKDMENLKLSSSPVLQLPTQFIAKYSKTTALPTQKITENARCSPEPCNVIRARSRVQLPDFFGPRWKVTKDNPVFEKDEFVRVPRDSYFSKYPIRYVPSMTEENIFRTVMIDHIPIEATYKDVLAVIRGGGLESIQLISPIGKSTDYKTARIVYKYETGAVSLYKHGQDPGLRIRSRPVRVWQIIEPTYPCNPELEEAIYEEDYTRLLVINPPDPAVIETIPQKLKHHISTGSILDIGKAADGMPMIEFTSVEEAIKALKILMTDLDFRGTVFDFEDDYCEGSFA